MSYKRQALITLLTLLTRSTCAPDRVNLYARKFLSCALPTTTTTTQHQPWPNTSSTSRPSLANAHHNTPGFTEFGAPFQCHVHNSLRSP